MMFPALLSTFYRCAYRPTRRSTQLRCKGGFRSAQGEFILGVPELARLLDNWLNGLSRAGMQ